ncbi:MAG: riboflavin biosynthesis protein RibF [Clostridiales Family XIII bacterium]|jgi:riboflavin kinase/FMN adenylyltransferase|nr:riboflavin biosynthesis protein RibF [Clostridiales Family XIII bacterium]
MQIYTDTKSIPELPRTSVALGFFDGLHLGHRALIARCVDGAARHGRQSAVFTFREHPRNVLSGKRLVSRLLSPDDKRLLLAELGVAYLFELDFAAGFHTMPPESFARDLLVEKFHASSVLCGFNFRFGAGASGDADTLIGLGETYGFKTFVLDPVRIRTEVDEATALTVSSTLIREKIRSGDTQAAAAMLGRPYRLSGAIAPGKKLGHTLGFPTANFPLDPAMTPPAPGVYVTRTAIAGAGGSAHASVTNVGYNPTTDAPHAVMVETHLLDWSGDLYGQSLCVEFHKMLRPEIKFDNLESLKTAIAENAAEARRYWYLRS